MIWFLVIGILLIIVEILTPTIFFFLAFGIGFLLNSFVFQFTGNIPFSLITTAITSALIFYYIRKKDIFKPKTNYKSNISNYIGKSGTIVEVLPNEFYRIKVFSEVWTAKSEEKMVIGDSCRISDRKDNTLIIVKQ